MVRIICIPNILILTWKSEINKILGQLITSFKGLEKLLENHDEAQKAKILNHTFVSCLNSYKPVKSMNDIVNLYRSIYGMDKIAQYMSKSMGIPVNQAEFTLKDLVKSSPYFKNNIIKWFFLRTLLIWLLY